MKCPFFSCVMSVKGPRPYMEEALGSLMSQGVGDELEVIIQDGDVEPDTGQSDALNKGFAKAKGEWLFWLNADDVLLPGALKKVRELISRVEEEGTGKDGRVDWIAGNTVYIDAKGIVTDVRRDARWYPWYGRHLSVWTGGPSAFFRRALWERCGGFDESYRFMMDIDLWTRWAKAGERFVGLGDYLWGFRIHKGSLTMGGDNEAAKIEERNRLFTKHNLSVQGFWRNVSRAVSLLDGNWFYRNYDARRFRGKIWSEIV